MNAHNHHNDGRLHSACGACDIAQDSSAGDQASREQMERFAFRPRIKPMITDAGPDADEALMARLGR